MFPQRTFPVALVSCLLAALFFTNGSPASAQTISGTVTAGDEPLKSALVELYQAGTTNATLIDAELTDDDGQFEVSYANAQSGRFLYFVVSDGTPGDSDLVLLTVAGQVGPSLLTTVHINELTTVATVYALSQFLDEPKIFGTSPGLDIAMATVFNLVNGKTGAPGAVISNPNNGTTLVQNDRSTLALLTLNTLANMVAACAAADDGGLTCDTLFLLATPNGGPAPTNTAEAIHNIARNPTALDNEALFSLADSNETYTPTRLLPPEAWLLALHFTEGGFSGPGRIAFDSLGRVWSNNNFALHPPGTSKPGKNIVALSPLGDPILGSPIFGLGLDGSGYGTAVGPDDSVWIASFTGNSISKFTPDGRPALHIAKKFVRDPDNRKVKIPTLEEPMGITLDQQGNLWVPNSGTLGDTSDTGSVSVYLGGDPKQVITVKDDRIHKPFNIAIDALGQAWVSNSGEAGGSVIVLKLVNGQVEFASPLVTSDGLSAPPSDLSMLPYSQFFAPRTIAIDTAGNGWVNNLEVSVVTFVDGGSFTATDIFVEGLFGGWGLAVDSSDRVWVISNNQFFPGADPPRPQIIMLDGTNPATGNRIGSFRNPALQTLTAVQIDQSGNVWVVNNWTLDSRPGNISGGDGLVQFIGLASPVLTPLIGPPVHPSLP